MNTAANLIAVIHIAFFLFVLGGMMAILRRQPSGLVRNIWFRVAHAAAIYIVLFEEATGLPCPLNVLQWGARSAATGSTQATSGMGGLLDFLLYDLISGTVLDVMYWSFGVLVLVMFWLVPPRLSHGAGGSLPVR
jgi:hypothetical protein